MGFSRVVMALLCDMLEHCCGDRYSSVAWIDYCIYEHNNNKKNYS